MSGFLHNRNRIRITVTVDPCNYPDLVTKRLHRYCGARDLHFIIGMRFPLNENRAAWDTLGATYS
jgi:hypothetical protein